MNSALEFKYICIVYILVIVLTRAAPALQYHFLLFFFLSWACCLQLCNFSVMFLWNCAQYFGFNNFGSQNTTSVQNVVLGSAWDVFFCCVVQLRICLFFTIKKKQNVGTWVSFDIGML